MFFVKLFFHTLGRLSNGIDLCIKEGLTSGKMLDYIYEKRASGKWIIGKWIDQMFLSHPGWEAVRIRRQNLEFLLKEAISTRQTPLKLVDIASGPASYILSVIKKEKQVEAICRDLDTRWLEEGARKAQSEGIKNVLFEKGDAFDRKAMISLKPHIVVSSGFYDWINEDVQIQKSIEMIFEALPSNGAFILSIQTSHPNQALVQKIFTDFNHNPLKMTMRSVGDVSTWLKTTGFCVEKALSDPKGYYSVIKARKP